MNSHSQIVAVDETGGQDQVLAGDGGVGDATASEHGHGGTDEVVGADDDHDGGWIG